MQSEMTLEHLDEVRGANVYDPAGEKIGSVEEVFYDEQTGRPEWLGLGTGFFGTKRVLVPVQGLQPSRDGLQAPYAKDQVKDSPDVDSDEIPQSLERELYAYYGLQASESASDSIYAARGADAGDRLGDSGLEAGAPDSARDRSGGETAVTRAEEELHVGKERDETGGVRLRKWVETEQVEVPVELRKEKVAVERVALDEPISTDEIGDEEVEVTVSEERPVVEKRAVAKERVSIGKDVDTERQTVAADVRKERIDVDEDE